MKKSLRYSLGFFTQKVNKKKLISTPHKIFNFILWTTVIAPANAKRAQEKLQEAKDEITKIQEELEHSAELDRQLDEFDKL